jgi:hypothetical protein
VTPTSRPFFWKDHDDWKKAYDQPSLTDQGLVLSSYAVGFHQALEFGLNMFKPWA